MSWVRVPPEAADFSLKKSLPQVSLNCVVFLCILECVSKFVYHVAKKTSRSLTGTMTGLLGLEIAVLALEINAEY